MHAPTEFASFRHGMTTETSMRSVAGAASMTAEAPAILLASDLDLPGMAMKSSCRGPSRYILGQFANRVTGCLRAVHRKAHDTACGALCSPGEQGLGARTSFLADREMSSEM